jgi:spermidine/putrescine transport system ATP-binding protein
VPSRTDMEAPLTGTIGAEPTGPTAAIELEFVGKDFASRGERVVAVAKVNLTIGEGEFFSLLGPSGCGKTTTLRMIAGFEEPSRGRILLYGADVTSVPPNHRDVNMVFQNYALFPHMTVAENVAFGLRRKGVERNEAARRVGEALELVELVGREHRRPKELSGGQQQRVALARALVNRPRALLLDEPLGALDLKLRQSMQMELKRIQREVGITFVYVTHDQGEALTMSDRLAVMNNGLVEQLGRPRELYEQPATRFVAGFIGTSNIIEGTVRSSTPTEAALAVGPDEVVTVPLRQATPTGGTVAATVRPEKMRMSRSHPEQGCTLHAKVKEVVYLGTATNYAVETCLGDLVVHHVNSGDDAGGFARGEEVWVSWQGPQAYQLVDPADSLPRDRAGRDSDDRDSDDRDSDDTVHSVA